MMSDSPPLHPSPTIAGGQYPRATFQQSEDIPVEKYDLILLFPFALKDTRQTGESGTHGTEQLTQWVKSLCTTVDSAHPEPAWVSASGKFPNPESARRVTEYAEWVFFHPFIRSFLYDSKQDYAQARGSTPAAKSLSILTRNDLGTNPTLSVEFNGQVVDLTIRAVQLYLFDTGVGVLSVEMMREGAGLSLKQVLDLQDKVRRLYAPYFDSYGGKVTAGHCPDTVTLKRLGRNDVASFWTCAENAPDSDPGRQSHLRQLDHVTNQYEPDTADVWRELLWPLMPRQITSEGTGFPLRYEQIIDERMPLLAYIAVPDPRVISEGDWIRLAYVDDSGDSATYPYSPAFLRASEQLPFAYDRFWAADPSPPAQGKYQQTRWLCCGYALQVVGAVGDTGFFANETIGAHAHLRYHYQKLALVAHFHRASLLRFKGRLADAVEVLQQGTGSRASRLDDFAKTLQHIQLDLLAFRNMYWFTELSNQIQPLELFDLLSKHLRTRELFQQVFDEADKAAAIVTGHRERLQNERTARLGLLAALFLVVAPLNAAVFTTEDVTVEGRFLGSLLVGVSAVLLGLSTSHLISALIDRVSSGNPRPLRGARIIVGGIALAAIVGAGWIYFKYRKDPKPDILNPHPVKIIQDAEPMPVKVIP